MRYRITLMLLALSACSPPPTVIEGVCGDYILEPDHNEACDDGNSTDGDGCSANCLSNETCGNSYLDTFTGEACDDGNSDAADGCSVNCQFTDHSPVELALGNRHTCVRFAEGIVHCWGSSAFGQTGYPGFPPANNGVQIGGIAIQITTGNDHTCALRSDGRVICWGEADRGRLGYGNEDDIGDDEAPMAAGVVSVGGSVQQITAGDRHTCALLDSGAVRCWGVNASGQLGYDHRDDIGDDEIPADAGNVTMVGNNVIQIEAGGNTTCALLDDMHTIHCWGAVASSDSVDLYVARAIRKIALGRSGAAPVYAILEDDTLQHWVISAINGVVEQSTPPLGGLVEQFDDGNVHSCALLWDGTLRCWGDSPFGQTGYGSVEYIGDDETPAQAGPVPLGNFASKVVAGTNHTCAILTTGTVRCWGNGRSNQLGYGDYQNVGDDETPAEKGDVPLHPFPSL